MRYAVISDVHGNLPAFQAVLADAKALGADRYLLLGDYATCFPWGNEVTTAIRGLAPAAAVRGNGEDSFIEYLNGRFELDNEQFRPAYWCLRSLDRENLEYLTALPERAAVQGEGYTMCLSHTLDVMHREAVAAFFSARGFRVMMESAPIPHDEYLIRAREALLSCPEALADIQALPEGVHLFGHNHIQFHMEHEGRLLVNPGSCGQALDFDTAAAYTLLAREGNRWEVVERRVAYDLDAAAAGLEASGFSACAPLWSSIFQLELRTGKVYMTPFVMHLMETGRALGRDEYPVCNEVFATAVETWDPDKI